MITSLRPAHGVVARVEAARLRLFGADRQSRGAAYIFAREAPASAAALSGWYLLSLSESLALSPFCLRVTLLARIFRVSEYVSRTDRLRLMAPQLLADAKGRGLDDVRTGLLERLATRLAAAYLREARLRRPTGRGVRVRLLESRN